MSSEEQNSVFQSRSSRVAAAEQQGDSNDVQIICGVEAASSSPRKVQGREEDESLEEGEDLDDENDITSSSDTEETQDDEIAFLESQLHFRKKLDVFLTWKGKLVFQSLSAKNLPHLESRAEEKENEGCYGVAPSLGICMGLDPVERKIEFFKSLIPNDLVVARIEAKAGAKLEMLLLCFDGNKRSYVEDLDIIGVCASEDLIPANISNLSRTYQKNDLVRCRVVEVNEFKRHVTLSMKGTSKNAAAGIDQNFPLGLITDTDLPEHYIIDSAVLQSGKKPDYDFLMDRCPGFQNPYSTSYLGCQLGVFSNSHSLMKGLRNTFSASSCYRALREKQTRQLVKASLEKAKSFLQDGDGDSALDWFSKVLVLDEGNVQALISRATINAQKNRSDLANRDLDLVLKQKVEDANVRRCIARSLISVGKLFQENSEEEYALKLYLNSLTVVVNLSDAGKLLASVHEQIQLFPCEGILEARVKEVKDSVKEMMDLEISRALSKRSKESQSGIVSATIAVSVERELEHPAGLKNYDTSDGSCSSSSVRGGDVHPTSKRNSGLNEAHVDRKSRSRRKKKSRRRRRSSSSSGSSSSNSHQGPSPRLFSANSNSKLIDSFESIEEKVNAYFKKCDQGNDQPFLSVGSGGMEGVPKYNQVHVPTVKMTLGKSSSWPTVISTPSTANRKGVSSGSSKEEVPTSRFLMSFNKTKEALAPGIFSSPSTLTDGEETGEIKLKCKWKPVLSAPTTGLRLQKDKFNTGDDAVVRTGDILHKGSVSTINDRLWRTATNNASDPGGVVTSKWDSASSSPSIARSGSRTFSNRSRSPSHSPSQHHCTRSRSRCSHQGDDSTSSDGSTRAPTRSRKSCSSRSTKRRSISRSKSRGRSRRSSSSVNKHRTTSRSSLKMTSYSGDCEKQYEGSRLKSRGYDPLYISPNYRGYNPVPAYKLTQVRAAQPSRSRSPLKFRIRSESRSCSGTPPSRVKEQDYSHSPPYTVDKDKGWIDPREVDEENWD